MEINLNPLANSNNELFDVPYDRAKEILDHMAMVCHKAITNFGSYQRLGITPNGIKYRIDIHKILKEMLSIAESESEKNYILFCAYTGIERVDKTVLKQEADDE